MAKVKPQTNERSIPERPWYGPEGRWKELRERMEAAEAERDALRDALRTITPDFPWDIDQDCRYCAGHYDRHEGDCPWLVAKILLERP